MKNKIFYLGASLAVATAFTACSNDELIQDMPVNQKSFNDGRIAFVQQTKNLTRGVSKAETKNHYEFGVFTFLDEVTAASNSTPADPASSITMPNFLVGYASTTSGKDWYSDRVSTQTYGNAASGDLTDAANNVSSWVYEQMGNNELTHTNATLAAQSLKYWNDAAASHIFVAYTPYLGNANKTAPMASFNIAATGTGADAVKANVTFTGLSSFYTSPAVQTTGARVVGLKATSADYDKDADISENDDELLNANEALYAYNKIDRANYGNDVPLTFQHVNAKINLKFYHTIKGYNVQLIDMVPEDVATDYLAEGKELHGATTTTIGSGKAITATKGVQLTPAIAEYVTANAQTDKDASYKGTRYEAATVTINGLDANGAVGTIPALGITGTETNTNLQFAITAGHNLTGTHAGAVADNAAVTSTLYALPVYQGGDIKTAKSTVTDNTANEVAKNTGYTLHVSYKLIPEDGTSIVTVYDARVFIAPDFCKWEAGKAYTYVFKITDQSNGTTDPGKVDPDGTTTDEPYIDPDDPRVPEDPALKPIVFDGVLVCDYDETPAGKTDAVDEWVITDPASWSSIGSTAWRRSPALLNKAQITEALGSAWMLDYTNLATSDAVTFNGETRIFTVKDKETTPNTFTWPATVAEEVATTSITINYGGSEVSDATKPETATAYSIYMWTDASTGKATKYTATPTEITYAHKTVTTTYRKSTQTYVKTQVDAGAATWTLNGEDTTAPTEGDLTPANGWASETKTVYSSPSVTYDDVTPAPNQTPVNAYAIVKTK